MSRQSGFSALILACAAAVRGIGELIKEDQAKAQKREGDLREQLDRAHEKLAAQTQPQLPEPEVKTMGASGLTLEYVQGKVNEACHNFNARLREVEKKYGPCNLPSGTINTQTMDSCHKSLTHLAEQNKCIDDFVAQATSSTKEQELRALIAELAPDK